ncbi:Zinc finger CCCH domain-containing protein 13 [Eumeta japonica]|uniref:Zinc finger CCCH domain-containing protein 13 n=1 Tax=Eumeta variegata TaxID=151549 RepID=A0A4C1UY53_EUMVA|nr:Zinc finger CCCH domain-containing protein 13 [Eumeta japonica]
MSKQGKRKITVELPKTKDLATSEHLPMARHGSCAYVVVRSGRSPDGEIDNWDQNDLEYADTDVLEKRRQQLQRELDLQMKMDSGKDLRKDKKVATSSSSSRSSSSSSASSSSSDASSSSSSSDRDARKKGKKGKSKRNSSSSSDGDVPSKKKYLKNESIKRDKTEVKRTSLKRDDRTGKKCEIKKKKVLGKTTVAKKSLSPGKKSGGTPPITLKNPVKGYGITKHGKSPARRDKNRSVSPPFAKEREKDRDRIKEREKDRDREKERDKERERNRPKSRSPRKARSRSPRRHGSHPKDLRRKESSERSRPVSPKKQVRRDGSAERHRKRSISKERDRGRDHKDRSIERKKHDDKDRYDRKDRSDVRDRGRDRTKDVKREDVKRNRGRDRGLSRGGADKGLEKPNKPMERLLPRPEERLAALAAISNRALEADKSSTNSKDRQDAHSERGSRKQERSERDRSSKRERLDSIDRDHVDYDIGIERPYEHGHPMDYDRMDDRYDDGPREDDRSPVYGIPSRERHYDPGYDMPGPPRNYPEDDDRGYGEHIGDHRVDIGYDDHRPRRDHSWERHSGSLDRERGYIHAHKEWDNDEYRGPPEWGRDRHWTIHDPQMSDWADKDPEVEGWHHRGPPPVAHRSRIHDDYNRSMRSEHARPDKRRGRGPELKESAPPPPTDHDDNRIPDDLSEISDDPDDILNQDDMIEQNDEDSQAAPTNLDEGTIKSDALENQSTQDTSGAGEEKESQDAKDDEDVTNLDFEEISDGELEEERTRGLGDALGVDWASLVAEVRRREQPAPTTGARERWRPERLLARLGLSVEMAGKEVVQNILEKDYKTRLHEKENSEGSKHNTEENQSIDQNGKSEEKLMEPVPDVDSLHPVAAIQVATEKRKRQRAALFGSGCEITRALCARRDLALRRHLCNLPPTERSGQSRVTPQPGLFHAARALLMQESVTG